jgi:hypothetical protein
MVMPFNRKPTGVEPGSGPATVDFDALWERVLRPLIEDDLGLEAIRADHEIGALIIKDMIERLALSDVVIADVSAPNANVYYEVGVRHAANKAGCVLIAANWAHPVFDLAQIRSVRYPLPEGDITPATADAARAALKADVQKFLHGPSVVWDTIPGYPDQVDPGRTSTFRERFAKISTILAEISSARRLPADDRRAAALALREKHEAAALAAPGIAVALLFLLRDAAAWAEVRAFAAVLPAETQALGVVQEQVSLAESKVGDHLAAIAALEALIALSGATSERRGLLGGRYKKLAAEAGDTSKRAFYLNRAIEEYDKGMRLDLNDYYPSSNLPRLLLARGAPGDAQRAHAAATLTVLACERARERNADDEWLRPTLLGAAFDAGDVDTARRLLTEMQQGGIAPFHLETTIDDLDQAVTNQTDAAVAAQLRDVVESARKLLPVGTPPPAP